MLSEEVYLSRQSLFSGTRFTSQVSDIKSFIFAELHIEMYTYII